MGFILQENKAILIYLLKAIIQSFKSDIKTQESISSLEIWKAMSGLTYSVITFFGSLRGSKGLKVNYSALMKYWKKGIINYCKNINKNVANEILYVIIPITGRYKGNKEKDCTYYYTLIKLTLELESKLL